MYTFMETLMAHQAMREATRQNQEREAQQRAHDKKVSAFYFALGIAEGLL